MRERAFPPLPLEKAGAPTGAAGMGVAGSGGPEIAVGRAGGRGTGVPGRSGLGGRAGGVDWAPGSRIGPGSETGADGDCRGGACDGAIWSDGWKAKRSFSTLASRDWRRRGFAPDAAAAAGPAALAMAIS